MKSNLNRQTTLPPYQENGDSPEEGEHHQPDWKTTAKSATLTHQATQRGEAARTDLLAANDSIAAEPRLSLIPINEVMKRTAIGRTKLYELVKSNEFPQPVKIGGATRWIAAEINDWIQSLMLMRKQGI